MLQRIRLQKFKGIEDAFFDVGPINVLVGANNSGKSSIIQGLHFGVGIVQTINIHSLQLRQGAVSLNPLQIVYSPSESIYSLGIGGRLREEEHNAIRLELALRNGEVSKSH